MLPYERGETETMQYNVIEFWELEMKTNMRANDTFVAHRQSFIHAKCMCDVYQSGSTKIDKDAYTVIPPRPWNVYFQPRNAQHRGQCCSCPPVAVLI